MLRVHSILILALAGTAAAQAATGGTQAPAPTAASPTATAPQSSGTAAPNSAPRSRRPPSITGVPRYRAGMRGPRGTTAPAATAAIETIGATDGIGSPNTSVSLPGIASFKNAPGITPGAPIHVRLQSSVDSGHAKNGDTLRGTLVEPIGEAPAGAPVELTVVATAAAGQMTSAGELSVQVIRINGVPVLSQVVTATGQEGKKVIPDAAPERGTEAILTPDKPITLPAA